VYIEFEWDVGKAESNLQKHAVSFEAAKLVFYDLGTIYEQDRVVDGETRWQAIGWGGTVALLVAHTSTETGEIEKIRIISARQANKGEKGRYERANR